MKLAANSRVSVIGGGISGLSFAYFLGKLRPDVKITIFEKENRVGGYINTCRASLESEKITGIHSKNGLKMEKGPRTLRGVSSGTLIIVDLMKKMGILGQLRGIDLKSEANKKYLVIENKNNSNIQIGQVKGELIEVPGPGCKLSTFGKFLTSPLGKIILIGILKDLIFKKDGKNIDNMSVEEFFTRHFGKEMINDIGSALMYGIYAADVSNLNAKNVMPAMVEIEKEGGSIIKTLLSKAFKKKKDPNNDITTNKQIVKIDENVQTYIDKFGSEFDMGELSKLLKNFPMLVLNDGLSTLCYGIRDNLPKNVKIVIGDGVSNIRRNDENFNVETVEGNTYEFDHVRSTVKTLALGKMLENNSVKEVLNDFKYTSVSVYNVLIPSKHVKMYTGFGFLVPKARFNQQSRIMGVIFDSDVEEHSKLIFPDDHNDNDNDNLNQDKDKLLSKTTITSPEKESFTKVTFMFNIDPNRRIEPTSATVQQALRETFTNLLGNDSLPKDIALEGITWWDAIPLYDVRISDSFDERREAAKKLLMDTYSENLSLGGTIFAPGVGVPDAVIGSLRGACELA
jgi:oxygen-dependent protoporphyrinogen oxidase